MYARTGGDGSSTGGAGGNGNWEGGGAGNPGGSGASGGATGTGGLLIIYSNNLINKGSIEAKGSKGGDGTDERQAGGGGSGGGSINIFYKTEIKQEEGSSISADGGAQGTARFSGGVGGTGSISITSTAETVKMVADSKGNQIPVPMEFYYVGGTKDTGVVISDIEGDDLENSKGGNQFVWIPVEHISNYIRSGEYYECDETIPEDERKSIEKYKGYYIGRYETGDKESTEAKVLRQEGAQTTNTVTVKKNQAPYNFVTLEEATNLANAMKSKEGYSAKTKLASSYAWDTAIGFIENTNLEYPVCSREGNYMDTTFTYTDITGTRRQKSDVGVLVPTGQTIAVNNIYDLGGNIYEYTSETYLFDNLAVVVRGGCYAGYCQEEASINRTYISQTSSGEYGGFRITLYM